MTGSSGAFGALGGVIAPGMMLLMVLRSPGPTKAMRRAGATEPGKARKPQTLGLTDASLAPFVRAGVVVRERDGRIWLDEKLARRRAWRNGLIVGALVAAAFLAVGFVLRL